MSAPLMQSPPGPQTVIDGHRYLYFGGTSYLGLHGHPEVIQAAADALKIHGIHSATSRRGFGATPPLLDAELAAADFFASEDAVHFISGYASMSIMVAALSGRFDRILVDAFSHYSVMDAAKLAGLPVAAFAHRDPADLKSKITPRSLVMTDGVFASTGSIAPIDQYLQALPDDALLLLDDAHAYGSIGPAGRGTLDHLNLSDPRLLACGTLSKALGGFGGIIPCSRNLGEQLRASHFLAGASAPPPALAAASAAALRLATRQPQIREQLAANVQHLRAGLRALGLSVQPLPTPVIGIPIGDAANMRRIHLALKRQSILLPHMRSYSGLGPEGAMRFAVFANHTPDMIDQLLDALKKLL